MGHWSGQWLKIHDSLWMCGPAHSIDASPGTGKLELALSSEWQAHGALTSEERQRVCRPNVIRLLGTYASTFFDLEAQKFVALELDSAELARRLDD